MGCRLFWRKLIHHRSGGTADPSHHAELIYNTFFFKNLTCVSAPKIHPYGNRLYRTLKMQCLVFEKNFS